LAHPGRGVVEAEGRQRGKNRGLVLGPAARLVEIIDAQQAGAAAISVQPTADRGQQ